jgi:hypothetical protein
MSVIEGSIKIPSHIRKTRKRVGGILSVT